MECSNAWKVLKNAHNKIQLNISFFSGDDLLKNPQIYPLN